MTTPMYLGFGGLSSAYNRKIRIAFCKIVEFAYTLEYMRDPFDWRLDWTKGMIDTK